MTNRRKLASYRWNRRTNARRFGEQQGPSQSRAVVVRWLHHGGFETSWSDELRALLASLARPVGR